MRVLLAHPSTELYGADRQFVESVDSFTSAGADVTVALPGRGELAGRIRGADVVELRFPVLRKSELRPHRLLLLVLLTPLVLLRLTRLIAATRPDVVYVNTVTLPHWVLAARLARRPVLVHVHEAEELSAPIVRRALYAPLLAAHRVVANSATTERVVTQAWRGLRRRVAVVPNGVPDPGARPASETVAGRLVLVSRLSPRKGIDVALEALATLRRAGRDVTLTLCGSTFTGYEWFEQQLRARAQRPDLAGAVTFAGFVDPVGDALAGAEAVVVPSLGESFGNAAVEGMLVGRATVASDVQGLAEIIDDGDTGLLVPPGDAGALAAAVGRLLDDPELRDGLARRGREVVAERYSLDRYRRDIVAVAAAVIDGTGSSDSSDSPDSPDESGEPREPGRRTGAATVLAAVTVVAVSAAACTSSGGSGSGTSPAPSDVISGSAAAPATSAATPATTGSVVPAPAGGDIDETVAPSARVTRAPVALTARAAFGDGVRLRLVDRADVTGKATRPGEVSGPALRLTLGLTNDTGRALSVDDAVVAVTDSRGVPLTPLADSTTAFRGTLAAGRTATGRYVFTLADGRHNPYTIRVSHSGRSAVVQLVGAAA